MGWMTITPQPVLCPTPQSPSRLSATIYDLACFPLLYLVTQNLIRKCCVSTSFIHNLKIPRWDFHCENHQTWMHQLLFQYHKAPSFHFILKLDSVGFQNCDYVWARLHSLEILSQSQKAYFCILEVMVPYPMVMCVSVWLCARSRRHVRIFFVQLGTDEAVRQGFPPFRKRTTTGNGIYRRMRIAQKTFGDGW